MPRLPPVIGIAGPARSGKDTVADFLLSMYGGYRYAMADPIRAMLKCIGIDLNDPYWRDRKEAEIPSLKRSPRYLMQTLGTEWGRELIHPNLWVYLAHQQLINNGPGMIISDIRFNNEADWVRARNGVIAHVHRTERQEVNPHASENGIIVESRDIVVFNNGTLEELQLTLRGLFDGEFQA